MENTSNQAKTLFISNKGFLTIKQAPHCNFYYTERNGIDSVSIVLFNNDTEKFGLIKEAKPPFSERENSEMSFKITSLGGSLFDMVDTDEYLAMSHEEQLKIATKTVIEEVKQEAGYNISEEDIMFTKKVVFNSMSNEYVWLFSVFVDDSKKCTPEPEDKIEALAEIVWLDENEIQLIECGKTLATITSMLMSELELNK